MPVHLKRIYEPYSPSDGYRVLVDRLWPRGVKKENARIDVWLKGVSPSTDLRKWFNHDAARWPEFLKRYQEELQQSGALQELEVMVKKHKILTLLYSAKEETYNQAAALLCFLQDAGY